MSKIIDVKSDRLAELLKERDRITRRLEEIKEEIKEELNKIYGVMIKQRNRENMLERNEQYYETDMMGGDDHE